MNNVIYKELKLSASLLTYLFILFGLLFLIPGYPILLGAFFVTLGIFKSFQNYIETNDIVFSALLPISKKDVVKGKFIFVCIIETSALIVMAICALIRNTILVESVIYRNNFMMNANCFALANAMLIFSIFNLIFVAGFFKTTYKRTVPFIYFMIVVFVIIGIAETLHHFPTLSFLNAFGNEYLINQLIILIIGFIVSLLITYIAFKMSCHRFEKVDL